MLETFVNIFMLKLKVDQYNSKSPRKTQSCTLLKVKYFSAEKTTKGKVLKVLWLILKLIIVLASLYFFICSLSFLSSAFQLLGGKSAGEVIIIFCYL